MVSRIPKIFQFEFRKWWKPSVASGGSAQPPGATGTPWGMFGINNPSFINMNQTGWLNRYSGVLGFTKRELNFGTGGQSKPYTLPGSGTFTLVNQHTSLDCGYCGYQVWRTPQGNTIAFLHIRSGYSGNTASGGTVVGSTGWPLDPGNAVGGLTGPQNAHLAVLLDQGAVQEFGIQ